MGTNFYWKPDIEKKLFHLVEDDDHPQHHIGKRSAAGLYCWDCGVPLVEEVSYGRRFYQKTRWSNDAVHGSSHPHLKACPNCILEPGASPGLSSPGNPAGVELGFAKPARGRPTGVDSAASFSWAQEPARVLLTCRKSPLTPVIADEYGSDYTGDDFLDLILGVPLWFTISIGQCFS